MSDERWPCGVSRFSNGEIYLSRPSPRAEAWLDARYPRKNAVDRVWVPHRLHPGIERMEAHRGTLAGRPALLLGKGPSLDRWLASADRERDLAERVVCTLNEVAELLPEPLPHYAFALDGEVVRRLGRTPRPATVYVVMRSLFHCLDGRARVVGWAPEPGVRASVATAGLALRFLGLAGVREVLAVGFDGWDQEAAAARTPTMPEDPARYASAVLAAGVRDRVSKDWTNINRDIRESLAEGRLAVTWWHRGCAGEPQERREAQEAQGVGPGA